jgi:hypothetical protein
MEGPSSRGSSLVYGANTELERGTASPLPITNPARKTYPAISANAENT